MIRSTQESCIAKTCGKHSTKDVLHLEERIPSDIFNEFYSKIDFDTSPFGYDINYARWRKSSINKTIIQYLRGGMVLDDGGGYGFLKEFLDDQKHEYYNMDCSLEMLKYDKSPRRCIGMGENLPFKDESFHNVVSGGVLEHTQDKVKYLQESYRVLKRGGIFVLNTPRTGWIKTYQESIWFWIPLLSYSYSRIKHRLSKKVTKTSSIDVPDVPSDENWLRNLLEGLGYEVIVQSRTDNHLFAFTHAFWRKFADIFIDPKKFGHHVFFACRKK